MIILMQRGKHVEALYDEISLAMGAMTTRFQGFQQQFGMLVEDHANLAKSCENVTTQSPNKTSPQPKTDAERVASPTMPTQQQATQQQPMQQPTQQPTQQQATQQQQPPPTQLVPTDVVDGHVDPCPQFVDQPTATKMKQL